ncbi:hypothetical protein B0A50_03045 [Salinomyces thailandicus]|uniref:Myosin class II heavy chain n=1 Tax=Salinomyces thailandicus TaxID=706561 RepID=A0A4U0U1N5_9PEZI|nr:hypothetical protein B0A50_03045 [Salinomyces thailandica]
MQYITDHPSGAVPPSSPPIASYDFSVVSALSPLGSRGRNSAREEDLLRLPLPRTPASTRSRQRDNSSDYYTAVWGSPYDRSVSPSGTVRTALSEQVPSEDQLESSPAPSFGLEHLLPSRLADFAVPRPDLSLLSRPTIEEEDDYHTPRSRTKRWVQLPQRQLSERSQWWNDESRSDPEEDKSCALAASSVKVPAEGDRPTKGHKRREDNRTLNQQSFLEILHGHQSGDMSGLLASKWAHAPDREGRDTHEPELAKSVVEKPLPALPLEQGTAAAKDGDESREGTVADKVQDMPRVKEPQQLHSSSNASPSPLTADVGRLEPPRLRKRLSWRGKTCIVSIPSLDFEALDLPHPLSGREVQARIKGFEDAGYNTEGFDLAYDQPSLELGHAKPVYPDESEARAEAKLNRPKVMLPDLNTWKRLQDDLIEAKLAALGVGIGMDEPPAPPPQDASRQSSGQYPPLPFSPPIPTGSAGSVGRPAIVRGHSHSMSVASPLSPGNGHFGHMHRHSTVTGPFGFPQLQTQQQPQQSQPPIVPGMQTFSPQNQVGPPSFPRGGSPAPAQLAALRQDAGGIRGPGSPLNQQILPQSAYDYSRGMLDDQRWRQHGYSQPTQQAAMPMPVPVPMPPQSAFTPQLPSLQQTPVLPELPEEDDEEELKEPERESTPEPSAYVPPHKRAQYNADIAVPSPTRGHRHNPSEGLEREVLESEERQEADHRSWIGISEEPIKPSGATATAEGEPHSQDLPAQETTHTHKRNSSRFNVEAPSFTFNPSASFEPASTAFTFSAAATKPTNARSSSHTRQVSSGTLNVAAPAFKPSHPPSIPRSDFSFSSQGPVFRPNFSAPEPQMPEQTDRPALDELPSIFGKVNIRDIVKPVRRSKAVAIVRPEEADESSEEHEDDEGRMMQSEDRLKRQRKRGDSGDHVPQFAEPTPIAVPESKEHSPMARSTSAANVALVDQVEEAANEALDEVANKGAKTVEAAIQSAHVSSAPAEQHTHKHKASDSLSALAKPFEPAPSGEVRPPGLTNADPAGHHEHFASISELEDGEIREDEEAETAPILSPKLSDDVQDQERHDSTANERIDKVANAEPSFDEIDAVMRQLNEPNTEQQQPEERPRSPLPPPDQQVMSGVTYLPEWSRSDAPSPSPARRNVLGGNSLIGHTDNGEPATPGWSQVRRLNKAEDVPASDWSGMLSSPDEEKLHARSHFFDNHIEELFGRVVDRRLQPLEESLRTMQTAAKKRHRSEDQPSIKRASSTAESDADDEDDLSDAPRQRPISRGRDKRVDEIKAAVVEALREQSPGRPQSSYSIADLHSALADMKVSFARAASASLELEDVRAVVEEVLVRQKHAVVPAQGNEPRESHHSREMSELEGRLNETLAGALEEANHRRAVEEREVETRRMLRLAEEELQLLRDSSRDDDGRFSAMEEERREFLERAERAEEAYKNAEERVRSVEDENEAMQGTLEEYRLSSTKWRQDIDEAQQEREELENTISGLERQLEDGQESSSSVRRRLEKLHHDMATAAGQLTSEKTAWKVKEQEYRIRCEALEAENAIQSSRRHELEEDLRQAHAGIMETCEARQALDQTRISNASLDELARKLQSELANQQALTARLERDLQDAKEFGQAEVQRTRMSLETDVQAASHQARIIRADLEGELLRRRTELEDVRMEAETARARHERHLEEEDGARREALRKVNLANSIALDEARQKNEIALKDLEAQRARALHHATEDKQRSEYILNERLVLSEAKLQHANDRILHLEERLEVAKSAAQAAAMSAQSKKVMSSPPGSSSLPEKISPQALRESILVLQEQLQERESQIDRLRNQVDNEGPTKLKGRDSEIAWLRELLAVRNEDLTELVNTLARPTFDRDAVRDTAIRIRANLQMEQQEKDRFGYGGQSLGNQALASLSSFTTPKAASLTTAFNKWRNTMESASLKKVPSSAPSAPSVTPSKARPAAVPPGYIAGLMTPPASNVRNTPSPETRDALPPPRLQTRTSSDEPARLTSQTSKPRPVSRQVSNSSDAPSTPLFGEHDYDHDAQDSGAHMEDFEDDDLDIADTIAPAFRSLESELEHESKAEATG